MVNLESHSYQTKKPQGEAQTRRKILRFYYRSVSFASTVQYSICFCVYLTGNLISMSKMLNVLYPQNVNNGVFKIEVRLWPDFILLFSNSRVLTSIWKECPVIQNMTETEKQSLELWARGDRSEYMLRCMSPVNESSVYCISFIPLLQKAKGGMI